MIMFYLGPNTVMPLASALAAVVGVVLIFWRYIYSSIRGATRLLTRSRAHAASSGSEGNDQMSEQGAKEKS